MLSYEGFFFLFCNNYSSYVDKYQFCPASVYNPIPKNVLYPHVQIYLLLVNATFTNSYHLPVTMVLRTGYNQLTITVYLNNLFILVLFINFFYVETRDLTFKLSREYMCISAGVILCLYFFLCK